MIKQGAGLVETPEELTTGAGIPGRNPAAAVGVIGFLYIILIQDHGFLHYL